MKKKPNGYWNEERIKEESLKYKTNKEFRLSSPSAYSKAKKIGIFGEISAHIKTNIHHKWSKDECMEKASKYQKRTDFFNNEKGAYMAATKRGWLNEICQHMAPLPIVFTKKMCKERAILYSSRSKFALYDGSAYRASLRNDWLDDICQHMDHLLTTLDFEACKNKASKYKTIGEFQKKSGSAYNKCRQKGWLAEVCQHMTIVGNRYKRCIYADEFENNFVYIGLTGDFDKRGDEHLKYGPVYRHMLKYNIKPSHKKMTDYLTIEEAKKMEGYFVEDYKKKGWNVLNKAKAGAMGSVPRYTYQMCETETLKYQSRKEFKKINNGMYQSICRNGWYELFSHMIDSYIKKVDFNRDIWTDVEDDFIIRHSVGESINELNRKRSGIETRLWRIKKGKIKITDEQRMLLEIVHGRKVKAR